MAIYRYVTEGSFDAYMWQALETKARFIAQVMTGDNAARRAEDIGGQELSYAEVKAIASGNPAVLTLAEADAELQRLTLLKKNHLDEQYVARRSVRDLPATIASLSERLSNLTADQATAAAHAGDPITIGSRAYSREDVPAVLGEPSGFLATQRPRDDAAFRSASIAACVLALSSHPHFPPDVYLEGAHSPVRALARASGAACRPERVERLAARFDTECARVRQDLAIAESQRATACPPAASRSRPPTRPARNSRCSARFWLERPAPGPRLDRRSTRCWTARAPPAPSASPSGPARRRSSTPRWRSIRASTSPRPASRR